MTMGRTRADGPECSSGVSRPVADEKSESELQQARRLADRAADAKADLLARISHEVRAPLNAIIGFAEVMIGERFGALGNEVLRRIPEGQSRASGEPRESPSSTRPHPGSPDRDRQSCDLTFRQQRSHDLVRRNALRDASRRPTGTHHHPDLAGACAAQVLALTPARIMPPTT